MRKPLSICLIVTVAGTLSIISGCSTPDRHMKNARPATVMVGDYSYDDRMIDELWIPYFKIKDPELVGRLFSTASSGMDRERVSIPWMGFLCRAVFVDAEGVPIYQVGISHYNGYVRLQQCSEKDGVPRRGDLIADVQNREFAEEIWKLLSDKKPSVIEERRQLFLRRGHVLEEIFKGRLPEE